MSRSHYAAFVAGTLCGLVFGAWLAMGLVFQSMPQSGDAPVSRPAG